MTTLGAAWGTDRTEPHTAPESASACVPTQAEGVARPWVQEIADRRDLAPLRIACCHPLGEAGEALGAVDVILSPDILEIVAHKERIHFMEDRDEAILFIRWVHGSRSLTGADGASTLAPGLLLSP